MVVPVQPHFCMQLTRFAIQNMADAFSTPSTQHPLQNYILKTFGLFLIHRNSTTMFQNTIVDEIWFALLLALGLRTGLGPNPCYPSILRDSHTTRNYLLSICVINRNQSIHSERHGNTITTFHFSQRSHFSTRNLTLVCCVLIIE